MGYIKEILNKTKQLTRAAFFSDFAWNDFERLKNELKDDHLFVLVSARRGSISYDASFEKVPGQLAKNFADNNLIVLYPEQFNSPESVVSFSDPMGHNEYQHYDKAREWLTGLLKSDDKK